MKKVCSARGKPWQRSSSILLSLSLPPAALDSCCLPRGEAVLGLYSSWLVIRKKLPSSLSLSLPLFYLSFKYPLHFDVKADYLTEVPLTCTLLSYSLYLNQQNQFPSFLSDLQWSSKILPFQWLVENSPIFAFGKCCQYLHGIKVWQLQFIYQSIRF